MRNYCELLFFFQNQGSLFLLVLKEEVEKWNLLDKPRGNGASETELRVGDSGGTAGELQGIPSHTDALCICYCHIL